jgi:hypothetical protein
MKVTLGKRYKIQASNQPLLLIQIVMSHTTSTIPPIPSQTALTFSCIHVGKNAIYRDATHHTHHLPFRSFLSISPSSLLLHIQGFDIPDTLCIFLNATITAEETHPSHTRDALADPTILVLECLINEVLGLAIRSEIIRHEIVITVLGDSVDKRGKLRLIAKHSLVDSVKDLLQLGVQLVFAIVVSVTEILDIFG